MLASNRFRSRDSHFLGNHSLDYLVIATGSNYSWPTKNDTEWSMADLKAEFKTLHEKINASETIVVIGGGASGTELSSELRHFHPSKKVVLIHAGQHLGGPGFSSKFYHRVNGGYGGKPT